MSAWISDDLLKDTQRVWSKELRRVISIEEAKQVLQDIKRLTSLIASEYRGGGLK